MSEWILNRPPLLANYLEDGVGFSNNFHQILRLGGTQPSFKAGSMILKHQGLEGSFPRTPTFRRIPSWIVPSAASLHHPRRPRPHRSRWGPKPRSKRVPRAPCAAWIEGVVKTQKALDLVCWIIWIVICDNFSNFKIIMILRQ